MGVEGMEGSVRIMEGKEVASSQGTFGNNGSVGDGELRA